MATDLKTIERAIKKEVSKKDKVTKAYQKIFDNCKATKSKNPKDVYKLPKTCEKYAPIVDYIDKMDMLGFHVTLKDGTKVVGWARELSKQLAPKLIEYERKHKKESK